MPSATNYCDNTEKSSGRRKSNMPATAVGCWKVPRFIRDIVPLGVCSIGICCCYWLYGYLQETLITRSRLGATFLLLIQAFTNVVVASVWMMMVVVSYSTDSGQLVSTNNNSTTKAKTTTKTKTTGGQLNHRLLLMTSFCYVVAMISSNESLQYVSYSTAVLMKSCKLIPSLIMGKIVEKRSYTVQTWISATFISFGMCLFHSSKLLLSLSTHQEQEEEEEQQQEGGGRFLSFFHKFHKQGGQEGGNRRHNDSTSSSDHNNMEYWYGIGLLLLSLSMDGLLGACQGLLKQQQQQQQPQLHRQQQSSYCYYYRPPTAAETMFFINLYSMVVLIPLASTTTSAVGTYGTGGDNSHSQLKTGIELLQRDVSLRHAVVLMNGVVGIGQIFIFLSLTWYTPYITTLITTTRKFFTIVISVVLVNNGKGNNNNNNSGRSNTHGSHNNEFGTVQWIAVILVFVGIYGSIMSAATKTTTTSSSSSSSKSAKHGVTDGNGDGDSYDDESDDNHIHDADKETKKDR